MSESYNLLKADVLVCLHLSFVAFVLFGQVLIVVGGLAGWKWVRNFWFRAIHLACIAFVAAEGVIGMECPLTGWERALRGGDLLNLSGASYLGAAANRVLYYQGNPVWFQRAHIAFGVLVLLTFFLVLPRLPGRSSQAASQESFGDADAPTPANSPHAASQPS